MKEILEVIETRISSPLFGYTILAFIVINWNPLFYLIVSDSHVTDRIAYFENNTTIDSLFILPILIAALGVTLYPWINCIFLYLCKKPTELRNSIQIHSKHMMLLKQQELEEIRSRILANREQELIERAKRDNELESIADTDLREKVKAEIENLRNEKNKFVNQASYKITEKEKLQRMSEEANSFNVETGHYS